MDKNKCLTKTEVGGVVKKEIREALKPYTTKQDLKEALDDQNRRNLAVFATKQDLKEGLNGLEEKLNWKFDKLLTTSEKIYAKLEKREIEQTAHDHLHKAAEDKLANHELRITELEKVAV